MQNNDQLVKLMEEVASAATMLSSESLSEVNKLQTACENVKDRLVEIKDGPDKTLEKAKKTTDEISALLQKIPQTERDNCEGTVDSVINAVMELQKLVNQVIDPQPKPEVASSDADESKNEVSVSETVIAEEDVPLVQDFITEACEHIESAEAGLLELETKPNDKEILNLIFRGFHTIKGMAGFLNLNEIGSLAHLTENLLDAARKGQQELSGANSDIIFESIDLLKKMLGQLQLAIEKNKPVSSQESLPQLLQKLEAAVNNTSAETASGDEHAGIQENESELMKSKLPETDKELPEMKSDQPSDRTCDDPKSRKGIASKIGVTDEKIKVSTTRLDNLVNIAGELMIAQLMVAEEAASERISSYELQRRISHQGKIVREIQELSMAMRMVQISGVFQKMARLVRDVSQKAQKKITFVTQGEETELDRSVVDKIADPLIHMLRNSVDHGIESPEVREQNGKSPVGRIELRAFHQAGNIVIEIEDDGKGLDKEHILKKAVENGIVNPDQTLTDEQIYKLIFHAGLSTAQKITSVSGRGVGMDVVKKNIESLRGRVDIISTPGKGTIFSVRLPLTLAMIDGQVVIVGDNRYIIPINSIVGTLRPEVDQLSTVQNRYEMVLVRGQLMPLIRLHKLFSVPCAVEDPEQALLVIVEDDERKCCLLVDELLAQQRVVIKKLGDGMGKIDCVSGGAIMGDGKVSLILDIPSLIKLSQQ